MRDFPTLPFAVGAITGLTLLLACKPAPALEPAAGVHEFNDEFDTSVSERWQVVNSGDFTHSIEEGELVVVPSTNNVWWREDSGPGFLQPVTGNFHVTTRVFARKASNPDEAVDAGYQFAGIIARDPASFTEPSAENYVFSVVGWRGEYMSAETKNTEDDVSIVAGPDWVTGDAELRICRVNGQFLLYNRAVGATEWQHAISYDRNDLPETLHVGPIAYTYTGAWDMRARFDYVRFAPVASEADCTVD
ncbi:MAG: hypothetical protein ACI81R_000522 [Bradymonadia bacterium]|jgi:hypothetical protein